MRYIDEIKLDDKKVALRIDFNLERDENGIPKNLTSLYRRIAPSLKHLLSNNSTVVLLGFNADKKTFLPLVDKISEHFKVNVSFAENITMAKRKLATLPAGEVLLCENLACFAEEYRFDRNFAENLAKLADIYVFDSFSESNQNLTSTSLVLSTNRNSCCAGLVIKKELTHYEKLIIEPKEPFCVILGGTNISSRISVLTKLLQKADMFLVGGTLANTFLSAQGTQTGRSIVERELFPKVMELIALLARRSCKTYFPVDFRIGSSIKEVGLARCVTFQDIPADSMMLDIGPATSILFEEALATAGTIFWNGPMGALENEDFSEGTSHLVQALAEAHGTTIAAGQATELAVQNMELEHRFDHLSTSGELFLDMISGQRPSSLTALGFRF